MTRDEQRKIRELKKALPQILKNKIKEYKFKKKDYMIWVCKKDLFFTLLIDVKVNLENQCVCSSLESIKPLWLDDLLWDLLWMSSNKEEPLSLRAIGAFTVHGSILFEKEIELVDWSVEELEKCIDEYLKHFLNTIQNSTIEDYYSNINNSKYHEELRIPLTYLHNEEYQNALNYLENQGKGHFCNGLIWINDSIRKRCKKNLFWSN